MKKQISFFDLQRFLKYLNESSAEGEGEFQLGHIFYGMPAKDPMGNITNVLPHRAKEALVKYPIINIKPRRILPGNRVVSAGYFFLESGIADATSDEQEEYQALKL